MKPHLIAYTQQSGPTTYESRKGMTSSQPVEWHDDKEDGRPDRSVTTEPGDLDTFGRPMRAGT